MKNVTDVNSKFVFEPLLPAHFPLLHKWIQEPHVWQWWGEGKSWTFDEVEAKYGSYTSCYKIEGGIAKAIHPFVVILQRQPIGFIQCYDAFDFPREGFKVQEVWDREDGSLAALDFYIGEVGFLGRGLGREIVQAFLKAHVFTRYDACMVDPEKNNKIAIKTYLKAEFSVVKDLDSILIMVAKR